MLKNDPAASARRRMAKAAVLTALITLLVPTAASAVESSETEITVIMSTFDADYLAELDSGTTVPLSAHVPVTDAPQSTVENVAVTTTTTAGVDPTLLVAAAVLLVTVGVGAVAYGRRRQR